MAQALSDLLTTGHQKNSAISNYITYLAEQSLSSLQSSESQRLVRSSNSLLLSIQGLSKRSYKVAVYSADKHAVLRTTLPSLANRVAELKRSVPQLDSSVDQFSTNFNKLGESESFARRKQALKLLDNADRLVNLMQVPALVVSAINVSPLGYASTLDLYAHIRRLGSFYPNSDIVSSVLGEAESTIHQLAVELTNALKAPSLKLAAAIRTIGWFKRIMTDLALEMHAEDAITAIFLVCRLVVFSQTLSALEPLRQLADEERVRQAKSSSIWSDGQHSERFLKRFIEVFREHNFHVISISKSVNTSLANLSIRGDNSLRPLPCALTSFPLHFTSLLLETLRIYLPTIKDISSRESILTQVLYCASSLGRLGAEFGALLATTGVDEWVELVKRHRLLASRLDFVISDPQG